MNRYIIPILMLVSLMACMPRAHAQTPTTQTVYQLVGFGQSSATRGTDAGAICSTFATNQGNASGWPGASGDLHPGDSGFTYRCYVNYQGNTMTTNYINADGTTATCPGGSVLQSGGACQCPAGSTSSWNGSSCVSPCADTTKLEQYNGDPGSAETSCVAGCTMRNNTTISGGGNTGEKWSFTFGKRTGAQCVGNPPTPDPTVNPCAPGQVPMLINGTQLCAALGTTGTTTSTTTSASTTSAGGTTTTARTSHQCVGDVCTDSTTQADGSTDDKPADEKFQMGTPIDSALGTSEASSMLITPIAVGGSRACPADIPLPHGASFSWAGTCQAGDALRPLILAMAWLAAGLLVIGGVKS